jgi:N-dimethylarginine dimethylaminohydrolase
MVAPLRRVIVKSPKEAFVNDAALEAQWRQLDYLRLPDLPRSIADHARFVSLLRQAGSEVLHLPTDSRTGLDSLYTHDPLILTDAGAIIFKTGKPERQGEGPAFVEALKAWDVPIYGTIDGPATAEGGDTIWLDANTLLVGRGFRTNGPGLQKLMELLQRLKVRAIPFDLPYWNGAREVLHLQSFMSLLDRDLAVVYRRLLPVSLFELLMERGIQLIDVPEEEYESMGCNVLALAPRQALMVAGNPTTASRIASAGCKVTEFDGSEICLPGCGGPTCLTRPLLRA